MVRDLRNIFLLIYEQAQTIYVILMKPFNDALADILADSFISNVPIVGDILNWVVNNIHIDMTLFGFIISFALVWGFALHFFKWLKEWIPIIG